MKRILCVLLAAVLLLSGCAVAPKEPTVTDEPVVTEEPAVTDEPAAPAYNILKNVKTLRDRFCRSSQLSQFNCKKM